MKTVIVAALTTLVTVSASAETFRFPADRINQGVWQVDIAWSVHMPPQCAGRWSLDYPAGFTFNRASPDGGNLRGNPGRGSYDIRENIRECPSWNSDYVAPARTYWHKVVVE